MNHHKYDTSGLIVLLGIGRKWNWGLLHALHLPFTGIFVGGFALISISLIAWYNDDPKAILKALSIVLAVKLFCQPSFPMASICGSSIPRVYGIFAVPSKIPLQGKTITFAIICLLESAFQKWMIAVLIFGTDFFIAIDKSAINVADSLGFQLSTSLVLWVFVSYTFLHLLVGIFWEYGYLLFPKN